MGKSIRYLCFFLTFALLTGIPAVYGNNTPSSPAAETPSVPAGTATDDPAPVATEDSNPSADTENHNSPPGRINVTFDVIPRQQDGKLYFDVETNLPDGMRFMCSIRDEIGVVYKTGSTMERLEAEVTDGRMILGPFPFEDRFFPSGEYSLYINSYYDDDQPESVMEIIGNEGENLTGQHVFYGMVYFGKEFMITGTEE